MTSFIKQKTATFSRPRIIVKYMDTLLTSKPLTTATPVDGYAIVDGDIVLFTNLSAINYTIHRATVTGVNITWTQLALGQSADGLPALGDEVFIQAGTYSKKIYWYDGVSFIEFKSGGGIGDSSIFGYLNSQDDNVTTQPFTTGNNATFLTAGTFIGLFNQKNETNPLNGKSSYTYTQGATSINDWIASYAITVPLKAKGVTNVTKFSYMYDGGNSDILPVVYDVTNSKILSSLSKFLENTNGVTKRCELVYDVPSTCSSIKIGFHVKVTNNGKILKFDDIETGVWTPQAVNLVEQESITYSGYTSKNASNYILFKTLDVDRSNGKNIVTVNEANKSVYIRYDVLKKSNVVVNFNADYSVVDPVAVKIVHYSSAGVIKKVSNSANATGTGANGTSLVTQALAGDYFIANTSAIPSDSIYTNFSITASAISENVVQSYAPSDRIGETIYLLQNVAPRGFISAMGSSIGKTSGTYQGDTYFNLYKVLWSVALNTAGQPYYISAAKGADALTDWNAGKTITIDESGLFTRAFKTGVTNDVGQKQDDTFQGHKHNINLSVTGAGSLNRVTYRGDASTTVNILETMGAPVNDTVNGDPRVSSETRPVNVAKYVFIRYATSAPDLIALPTSKINEFTANFDGVSSITQKSSDWIDSISISDTSLVRINFKAGLFTVLPTVTLGTFDATVLADPRATIASISTSYVEIRTGYSTADQGFVKSLRAFQITVIKNAPDYTAPGVFVGNVAKNQVAIVEYRGNSSNITLSGTAQAMPTNTVTGDSGIVSVGASSFTLQSGEYELDAGAIHYLRGGSTGSIQVESYIYNTTDNVETKRALPSYAYAYYATSFTVNPRLLTRITITKQTTFEFRHRVVSSTNFTGYLGFDFASPNDINGYVKITKLNGQ